MKQFAILILLFGSIQFSYAQIIFGIDIVYQDTNLSFRGLSVVDNKVIWASGTKGTVVKSVDGGTTFQSMKVNDCSTCDFRDIEAFDEKVAVIISSGDIAKAYKTIDGGATWNMVLHDTTINSFLDGMDFTPDSKIGYIYGDPTQSYPDKQSFFALYKTEDLGNTWRKINVKKKFLVKGEASFASSGTGILAFNGGYFAIASGGKESHIYVLNKKGKLLKKLSPPFIQGEEGQGINSLAFGNASLLAVGGDFMSPKDNNNNFYAMNASLFIPQFTHAFNPSKTKLSGYKSCIAFLADNVVFATGTSGTDVSMDGGANWQKVSDVSYHVCKSSKNDKLFVFAGSRGKIGVLRLEE